MVLALIEHDNGSVPAGSAEALTFARDLAEQLGEPVAAVAFGEPGELPAVLAKHGVPTLYLLRHELLAEYSPQSFGDALAGLIGHVAPSAVIGPGNDRGNEMLAQAAARSGLPLATNCTAVRPGEVWEVTRARWGGILLEDAELTAPVKLCTLAPAAVQVTESAVTQDVAVETFTPDLDAAAPRAVLVDRERRAAGVTLATAPVVVSGGRGVGSSEGYVVLEELAGLLGAAVGCSRVATNNGWRPHSDQVGLTGTRISPALYIACGISGATQHWVGCMHAKTILAINTDAEAPMVTRAAYAVIGDVHKVLPAVIEEIRSRAGG